MTALTEFRVTFGTKYLDEPHPSFPAAHPDSWVTILAVDELDARRIAVERLGRAWCDVYDPESVATFGTLPNLRTWAETFPGQELARWSE